MKKLGFGCMRLPLKDPNDQASVDLPLFCRMADTFLKRGFTYFDTAYVYHNQLSETFVKEALVKRHPRESFTLATKMPTMMLKTKEDMERIFNEQLEKCGVEYFDYYLLHCITGEMYAVAEKLDAFEFIRKKKEEGKIRNIGFSFHDNAELLETVLKAHPEVDFVQLQLNYLDWDDMVVQSRLCYEVCEKHGKPVVVMEPVKGGTLAKVPREVEKIYREYAPDSTPASWAIRFAASLPNVMVVLSGMSDQEQLLDNTGTMRDFKPLNEEEKKLIGQAATIIKSSIAIPCTGCQYCVAGCPKNIPIPKYFSLFNDLKRYGGMNPFFYFMNFKGKFGLPSDCIECRQCESHCPQHIEVTKHLKEVAAVFEKAPA